MSLTLRPVTFAAAAQFVASIHRHHKSLKGHKFSIGAEVEGKLIGVVVVSQPMARASDDGYTAEVVRLCTDGTPDACSFLYGAAARCAKAMGYLRIITYTLLTEPGTSLRASGFNAGNKTRAGSWNCPSRPRTDKHPTEAKQMWYRILGESKS
ncbi:MAG TPA: XF1762 family protein [Candidatus Saccharimonadia bacterium]|nr:XF1762 family protein [Candidatus Saccharimonadia bacterium]